MLTQIHPKIPMRNKEITRNFYIDSLGFEEIGAVDFNEYLMTEFVNNDSTRGFVTAGMRLFNVVLIRSVLQNDKIVAIEIID